MKKHDLTPEKSFDLINKAIANFKMNYRESSKKFLLWGWLFTFASFSNFVILKILRDREAYELMNLFSLGNWAVFMLSGFIIIFFLLHKESKKKKVYSHLDNYINNLWWVTVASFLIATFLCVKLEIEPPSIMLLIAGLATTTTGLFIKFRPVIIGGMAFFVFSIASTFVYKGEYTSLIVCVAIICGYLIPGYLLKSAKE